ncbi:peptide-methionine (S)-S-oxide reductase MsrA [Megasphaera hominis]|mgnify:FL=1|jgi:peptide-methionine (S)-S-oxide reductase|uniref:Peptide methionine sulfoxide reductase MsrA n=1 Tax=Megasphaera hominis TaxID=159836 RepID=A0ABR6VGV6_9FIRM|nr:peptide-methionine (S)-S-oxide reductase MsrA [Megasphaera hominis]MBC3535942.1 peptide-methionine (S)-S-oxide reductase MsrA [Megasphaera hominis]
MTHTIYLAGGCFWGMQKFLDQFAGILSTETGYANGHTEKPTYEEVCTQTTGHTETVKVTYDDAIMPTAQLLDYYFMVIDPLSVNRQGGDAGTNYRTGIYYEDERLLTDIRKVVNSVADRLGKPLAVEVLPLQNFYPAEEYHQKYLDKNPGGYCHIRPAMMHLRQRLEEKKD